MTLAEKIGQMSQIERENATFDVMRNYFIGILDCFLVLAAEIHIDSCI
jgi:hypothetical protein